MGDERRDVHARVLACKPASLFQGTRLELRSTWFDSRGPCLPGQAVTERAAAVKEGTKRAAQALETEEVRRR